MTIPAAFLIAALTTLGWGAPQRHAALVNADLESGLRPGIVSTRGDAGLWQLRGPRKAALFRFAAARGSPWSDAQTQVEFLDLEWRAMPASRAFFAATSVRETLRTFCVGYERRARC